MIKLQNIIIVLLSLGVIFLNGCGFIMPWELSAAMTAADVAVVKETGRSTSELVVGAIADKDCQWSKALDNAEVTIAHVLPLPFVPATWMEGTEC